MTELNTAEFRELTAGSTPTVVDFWATWCMPCKLIAPVVEELSDELDGKANFGKVDVDQSQELAQEYGIASIPTIVVFQDGKEQERMVGVKAKEELKAMIEKYL